MYLSEGFFIGYLWFFASSCYVLFSSPSTKLYIPYGSRLGHYQFAFTYMRPYMTRHCGTCNNASVKPQCKTEFNKLIPLLKQCKRSILTFLLCTSFSAYPFSTCISYSSYSLSSLLLLHSPTPNRKGLLGWIFKVLSAWATAFFLNTH